MSNPSAAEQALRDGDAPRALKLLTDHPDDEYRVQIQTGELNALNACLAILRFKQGFGRLIRSATDRGVCAILDRRVISKRYGRRFIESLPPCSETRGSIADLGQSATDWLSLPRE